MICLDTFGEIIANNRLSNNLTQSQLAEVLMVTPQAISKWERGSSFPDIETLVNICEYFNLSIDDVINECSEKSVVEIDIDNENIYTYLCTYKRALIVENLINNKYPEIDITKIFYALNTTERQRILKEVIDQNIKVDIEDFLVVLNTAERYKILEAIRDKKFDISLYYINYLLSPIERKKYLSRRK